MLARIHSLALHGISGARVTVEVDIAPGLPNLFIVGLPDASVREAKNRVISAVRNSGFEFPLRRITVNLAPADIKKEGPAYDLPIAAGVLAASERLSLKHLEDWALIGELALDGALRPVKGVLPMAIEARRRGYKGIILPEGNHKEAAVVEGIQLFRGHSLMDVCEFLNRSRADSPTAAGSQTQWESPETEADFCDVKGQQFAKRALEAASAGAHNVIMVGPPGSGKTMLSKRVPSILPPFTLEEAIETSKIHSVAGLLRRDEGLVRCRPFRNPHHSISDTALIGGGQVPRPGEVSLAQNGVLFLDELPEFNRKALEVLRQPLESREVVIARARETFTFPASFMLVAAMNPCPCGYSGHPARECACNLAQIEKYRSKISGPLLDRMDIQLEVPPLKVEELASESAAPEKSADVRARVVKAREIQKERFKNSDAFANAQMNQKQTRKFCELNGECRSYLKAAVDKLNLSARAYDRILKVSRTLADLAASDKIGLPHLAEAIQYRSLDRLKT